MRTLGFLVAVTLLSFAGCKQGVGDRCQVESDCDDGLLCVLPSGGTPQAGGTCQPRGGIDGSVPDLTSDTRDMAQQTGG